MSREDAEIADGASIRGEVIYCEARKLSKPRTISNSSKHRTNQVTLDTAFCIITKSERWTDS